jgi:hypothetical protein
MSNTRTIRATGLIGSLQLVGTYVVSGAARTDMPINGLDLAADLGYVIDLFVVNALGSDIGVNMFFNGDTTATNYDREVHGYSGTTVTGGRGNDANCMSVTASQSSAMDYKLGVRANGKTFMIGTGYQDETTSIQVRTYAHQWRTAANVTSLSVTCGTSDGFGIGSYVRVYKIAISGGSGTGESVVKAYNQPAHGFSAGMPIYMGSSLWAMSDRDSESSPCDAIVSTITDGNNFSATHSGTMTLLASDWDARSGQTGGLTQGDYYWVGTTAGSITNVQPTTGFSQIIGKAESTTRMRVMIGPVFGLASTDTISPNIGLLTQMSNLPLYL